MPGRFITEPLRRTPEIRLCKEERRSRFYHQLSQKGEQIGTHNMRLISYRNFGAINARDFLN
jgi:hypothetical protein